MMHKNKSNMFKQKEMNSGVEREGKSQPKSQFSGKASGMLYSKNGPKTDSSGKKYGLHYGSEAEGHAEAKGLGGNYTHFTKNLREFIEEAVKSVKAKAKVKFNPSFEEYDKPEKDAQK
jgi:hypothetical protein